MREGFVCPLPLQRYPQIVSAHGGGGQLMHHLIQEMIAPLLDNPKLQIHTDSAVLPPPSGRLVFTTDSYVVQPIFFAGGDIGKLAVCGTINDLAVLGAHPLYLSLSLILEEGLPLETLHSVLVSIRETAQSAGVSIVTGDTKVIATPQSHGLLINTSGIGSLPEGRLIAPSQIQEGDVVLVSGDIGRHGLAIMLQREGLEFESTLESDLAPLHGLIHELLDAGIVIHAMRDLTRGGLASALIEMAENAQKSILLEEEAIPIHESVAAACEILGLDALYAACEGRFVAILPPDEAERALPYLAKQSDTKPAIIGQITAPRATPLALQTRYKTQRILQRQSGEQMPRIC